MDMPPPPSGFKEYVRMGESGRWEIYGNPPADIRKELKEWIRACYPKPGRDGRVSLV